MKCIRATLRRLLLLRNTSPVSGYMLRVIYRIMGWWSLIILMVLLPAIALIMVFMIYTLPSWINRHLIFLISKMFLQRAIVVLIIVHHTLQDLGQYWEVINPQKMFYL